MTDIQRVLVVGEVNNGLLHDATAELLAAARTLIQPETGEVVVGLAGNMLEDASQSAVQAGADGVYTVDDPQLEMTQIELQLVAWHEICRLVAPDVILLARTALGRDLAPRLACRLGVSLLQDCLAVAIEPSSGRLVGTRPVYGGNVLLRVRCTTGAPQMAVIRPKSYAPLAPDSSRQGERIAVTADLRAAPPKVTILRAKVDKSPGVKLEEARVVVAGGRGLGGPEPFGELQELAGLLNAGIGASRAAVDAGWVPGNWQIGLTGRTITPELYITVGISGASQHMAGCSSAKAIVAINKDREANIFRAARYGVVGDWHHILPAFLQAVRDLS